ECDERFGMEDLEQLAEIVVNTLPREDDDAEGDGEEENGEEEEEGDGDAEMNDMFYDLNIALPEAAGKPNGSMSSQEWARVIQTIEQARELGYGVVALNQVISGKLTPDHLKIWTTMPNMSNAQLSWSLQTGKRTLKECGSVSKVSRNSIRVLRRVTALISEADHGHSVSGTATSNEYDLVAVRPLNEKMLMAASGGSWTNIDMISLDMAARWGFFAKHKTVGQALSLGYALEISYQGALDSSTRHQWVSNTAAVVRVTRGRNLVWTSGVQRAFDLRSPYDVTNLGDAVQLNKDLTKRGVSENARALLVHAFTRTGTLRAAVAVSENKRAMKEDGAPNKRARIEMR
ncbi:RNA-binding RNA processing protein rpp1, partial [Coemansia sp. RSA 485]